MLGTGSATRRTDKRAVIADHFDISYELEHQISGTSKEKYLEGIRNVIENGVFTMVRQRDVHEQGAANAPLPIISISPTSLILTSKEKYLEGIRNVIENASVR